MKRIALGLAASVLGMALAVGSALGASAQEPQAEEHVVEVVELEGVIDPTTAGFLATSLEDAAQDGAEAVIIQLDTPGGLDVSMRDMVQRILRSPVPVVVWVGPPGARAASAGVFLVYASHLAAMADATNLGAAHPVNLGGGPVEEKAVNDAAEYLEGLAEERGRDREFASEAVRESASISVDEALEREVVEIRANSINDLLRELDGRMVELPSGTRTLVTAAEQGQEVTLRFREPGLLARILHAITDPTLAYLLLVLGFWALVFELSQPGVGIAGVAGAISLILAFYSLAVLPVSLAGLLLVLLGLVLFTIDVFTAGLGVFTVGGALALTVGSLILFSGAAPEVELPVWVVGLMVAGSVLFFGFAMTVAMRARRRQALTGQEGLIGLTGESRADLAPEGQVWVKGALWRARALQGSIPAGRKVRVRRVDGLLLLVQEETEGG
ncbi:MAG TPA: nodulation protein NfeD [Actinomycetota bacterium]|nr:nodulation protein NfeD [Actinomycetota bacterium]